MEGQYSVFWPSGDLLVFGLLFFFFFVFVFEHPFSVVICGQARSYMPVRCLFVFFLADDLVYPVRECLNHRPFMLYRRRFDAVSSGIDLYAWIFGIP